MGLTLIPHQQNYLLPFTYNTSPHPTSTNDAKNKEAKFQLSFKVPLINNIAKSDAHLYFGYTQLCMWQVYEQNNSAPFRDTNYEPEGFVSFDTRASGLGFNVPQIDVGISHQSNGVGAPDSRSWNRIYTRFVLDRGEFLVHLKPWVRIPEDSDKDDNNDINHYMGYGEYTVFWIRHNHVLSMMLRNNFDLYDNKGAIELNYSFPLTSNLTGLLQYFSGYGESLIDYNRPNNRYSIGIALSEWR